MHSTLQLSLVDVVRVVMSLMEASPRLGPEMAGVAEARALVISPSPRLSRLMNCITSWLGSTVPEESVSTQP